MEKRRRILNRIVFINIANSDYSAAEIAGNTCFVGTNNLGKTTLQRAILFFYSANTRGLGISSSQRSFEDYYFQYPNSYIIYEIATEEGFFHVMVYRNNKICFRFVNSAFDPELYIANKEALLIKEVLGRFNEQKIDYSDQIETYERYRNIIYGADPDKRYRKYALLKGNSMYQNIPLAITSIFLSSESEIRSEFVKDCIANSINTKHSTIELKTIERQLRQFSERYQDIEAFFRKDNVQRGELIKDNFQRIKNLKQTQRSLAAELGGALKYTEGQKEILEKELAEKDEILGQMRVEFREKERVFQERLGEINEERGVVKAKIREAEKKQKEYDQKNIHELMKLAETKASLMSSLKAREEEYLTLTAGFRDTELQFKVRFESLENEKRDFVTLIKEQGLELDKQFQKDKAKLKEDLQREKDDLREQHTEATEGYREELNAAEIQLREVNYKIKDVKNKVYFKAEISIIKKQLDEIRERKRQRKSAFEINNNKIASFQQQADHLKEKHRLETEGKKAQNREEIIATEDLVKEIESKLSIYQDALFGYLQDNYPDWYQTIGKVVNEELLYRKDLKPEKVQEAVQTLYGLKLDLGEVEVHCRSLEELEKEKSEYLDYINQLNDEFQEWQEAKDKELYAALSATGKKIGELKNEISRMEYEEEQDEKKEKQAELDLMDWNQKAQKQKEEDTTALYVEEQDLQGEVKRIKGLLNEVKAQFDSKLASLEKSYNEKLVLVRRKFEEKAGELSHQREDKLNELAERKARLEKEKKEQLKKKGVDDSVLHKLKEEINQLQSRLEQIEKNATLVSDYLKDKRELFDRLEEFNERREKLDYLGEEVEAQKKSEQLKYDKRKHNLQEGRQVIADEIRKCNEGFDYFEKRFKTISLYDRLKHILELAEATPSASSVIDLCTQLQANDTEFHTQFRVFRNHVTEYAGRFRPDNHFNFKLSHSAGDSEYERFAGQLQDFYNENKIQTSIAEVAKSHGMLIDAIATKVKTLTENKGRINRMVSKMEADFGKASFESSKLIEFIKLRSEDSENKVLRKLQKIADFREQNPFSYGETNLFNLDSKSKSAIDKQSVELLNDLLHTIAEEHKEEIRVQDLFELKFRIKEGKNDTGWIEKIDKVGSTGTDMLVKAVIYITLLNVFIKESTERTAVDFHVHCIIDEVGQISANYLKELIAFAEERNIYLINGLPNESKLETHYNYTYKFKKTASGSVRVIPLLTMNVEP
ncbi:ATP-binding protein [Cytophagaceae bacterium ABcell3]|nr:ATP-binding protein [Cytophagaceae bacterium ABcell3]